MGGFVGFLHDLLDPTLAFVFFWLGLALIVLELLVPATSSPARSAPRC